MSDTLFDVESLTVPAPPAPPDHRDVVVETRRAIKQVDEHADPTWKDDALEAVRQTCLACDEFISDDVWVVGSLRRTREDRALGPVFLAAKKNGWCAKTDRVRPSVRSHLSGKPIWVSLIHKR